MSNFNKVVTNIPVSLTETEMSNLSQTFSGIIQGGGGGGEGKRYIGDGVYVTVNNDANPGVISLTQTSLDKLNKEIPSAVSSFPDSVQYAKKTYVDSTFQTKNDMSAYATTAYVSGVTASIYYTNILGLVDALNAKQDTLSFGYDENYAISSINSHKLAGAGGVTGDYYSASNPSGFINSAQAETQILAKNYITSGVSQLDNFYSKTDTSSRTEIANAIKDFITEDDVLEKHYLTKASGDLLYVPIPQGLSDGQYYAMTTSSWKVIQGAGDVSGISTVAHDDTLTGNGNNENLGVDTTVIQTKLTDVQIQNITDVTTLKTASSTWDNVSAKLNTTDFNTYTGTTAPSTYQPIGNYLSSNALEGYATTALLDTISSKIESDIPTTVAQLTDSENYYKKSETSGSTELSTEFAKYQPKGNYLVADDITGKLDKSIYANASGNWENTYNVVNQYSAAGKWLTAHQSLTNYYTKNDTSSKNELSTEFVKYLTTSQYNTDSATFALKTDLNGLVNSASVTTNDNYVMTNSGWKVLTLPGGGMTQVYHDTTLTGDGNANDNQLGVKWETLSSNTIAYSNSAFNLTNGTSVSSFNQISAAIDSRYSKTASDGRYLQKSLDNTLTGDGTDNKKLGVAWSALSGNTIASAEKAGEAQGFRWGDNTYQDTSAALTNLWNAKNHVTLQTANNILTVDNNDNTSATLSAMSYVNNTLNNRAFLPQKACVCLESEITTMATLANGQGMLFFVVSAH